MTSIQSVKAYTPAFTGKEERQARKEKRAEKAKISEQNYTPAKNRKRWAITAGIVGALSTVGQFITPYAKKIPVARKILAGVLGGIVGGTAVHFLFTKNSKLNNDKVTDNFGKRTGIMAGIGAAVVTLQTVADKSVKAFYKDFLGKGSIGKVAAMGAVGVAVGYAIDEGIKSIFDKSAKKEKQAKAIEKAVAQAMEAKA